MDKRTFEVKGLLRLRDDTQRKTNDKVQAASPVDAVRAAANGHRRENGKQFREWLHVMTAAQ